MNQRELTSIPWPRPLSELTDVDPSRIAAKLGAARQRAVGGVCADLQANLGTVLPAWCAAVRRARLVPMLRVRLEQLDRDVLGVLETSGPLLVVLAPSPGGLAHGERVRRLLAGLRSPLLRFADGGLALCHRGPWQPDVALAGSPQASADPRCGACGAARQCPGPSGPSDPVRPLPTAVSNQFDLRTAGQTLVASSDCPMSAPRVLQGARAQVYEVAPPQERSPEVRAAILRGQLYLDVSEKARLDDFAADLRLLEPVHAPHETAGGLCAGSWQVAERQPFAEEEAALRSVLATLRGTVVDVGAGPIHYLRELETALENGTLRYIAVEPDRDALATSRRALPAGVHLEGTGEHLPLHSASADAVMMLRSFNHLRDPDAALREAARVLRPGGKLLLVDNVLFGLLRSDAQRQRAHAIPVSQTPFEHFRNADAAQAIALLRAACGAMFAVERVHDVGAGRSNQWLVLAQRVDDGHGADS